jgi:hypothetical protein
MKTRVIPTKVHGVLDYVTAPALAAAPELFGLNGGRASALAPRVAGTGAAVYSALTDYELGVRRVIPMRVHLLLDAASGAALATAPWLFGSARKGVRHWLPHALVGATEIGLALTTREQPPVTSRLGGRRKLVAGAVAAGLAGLAYAASRAGRTDSADELG